MRVTIVTVSYNSSSVLGRLLGALQVPGLQIIVIDNGSSDESRAIAQSYPNVRLIAGGNIGYGRAANRGFSEVATPYALLLNPDVVISPEAVEKMLTCADAHPDIGLLGAQMFAYDAAGKKIYERPLEFDADGLSYTDWLVGAAMLIRMDALAKVGGFDERIFLFYEETDLCRRFAVAGYKLAIMRDAEAEHVAGTSCGVVCSRIHKLKYWHAGWSKAYYARKHSPWLGYAKECCARLPNTAVKFLRAVLAGDKQNSLKHYYILRGTMAAMIGRTSFKNGVGRHT